MLWTAPELLRGGGREGTKNGDVYSFAIILQEILLRAHPFALNMEPVDGTYLFFSSLDLVKQWFWVLEIVRLVRIGISPPLRPKMQNFLVTRENGWIIDLMFDCWQEEPDLRPSFKNIVKAIEFANGGK